MTQHDPRLTAMARNYPASSIRTMFTLAAQRADAVKLTVGEPDFTTPEHIKRAAIEAIERNETRYVDNAGLPELRQAIADRYSIRWGRQLDDANVMVTFGGMEALALALDVTVTAGDDVLIADPGYPNYLGQIHRAGARAVTVPVHEEDRFKLRAANVAGAITERTSALILNSPSNPLGSVVDTGDLLELTRLADEHGFTIISDEVYDEIVFDGREFVSLAAVRSDFDRYLVVNSFSKTFAMTGWRCGYVIGPATLIAPMPIMQEGLASCVQPFVQRAAIAAITGPQDSTAEMVRSYERRRDLITKRVNAIDGIHCLTPEATFYAFVNVSSLRKSSWDIANELLDEHALAVIPGSAFGEGGDGYLRMTFAVSDSDIERACDRLEQYLGRR